MPAAWARWECPWVQPRRGGWRRSTRACASAWMSAASPTSKSFIKIHNLSGHGIYYYVPSLLKHFQTAQINELIVPRAHLSVNGRLDDLTPPAGVERVRDYLTPLYQRYGKPEDCHIELFDCPHWELPSMRKLILEWMDTYLVKPMNG